MNQQQTNEKDEITLNAHQLEAVATTEGRVRVIAGAGSGKTGVLTQRYLHLVNELGISPTHILCMTFTNKAAQEMRLRIEHKLSDNHGSDFICTIHGFCLKVLRRDIYRLGFPKTFNVMDEDDQKMLAKEVFEQCHITRQQNTLDKFIKEITAYKSEHKTEYIRRYMLPGVARLLNDDPISLYLSRQTKFFALDFNDLIHFAIYLFRNYPDVRAFWQKTLDYVMMDEAQDCNENDWFIMETLTERTHNLFAVGDPDQAIYEWRGAVPKLFIDFEPDTDIVLDENYRSTPEILEVANAIIDHNQNRIPKNLFTRKQAGCQVLHFHGKNEEDEGKWVAGKIKILLQQKRATPGQIAVLYRSSFLSRGVEQALVHARLPYSLWAGVRFFERKEIKDVISYLRLLVADDDMAFQRVINVPSRKLGKVFMGRLKALAESEGSSLYQTLKTHSDSYDLGKGPAQRFVELIETARHKQVEMSLSDLIEYVLQDSGLKDMLRLDGNEDRLENVAELLDSIKRYEVENANDEVTLNTYLQDISLFTDSDADRKSDTVKLMTIHQAKGLEFPYVFVAGLNEGTFPNARTMRDRGKEGEEEERRLMYVAVTRAECGLYLTESEGYNISTQGNKLPSRFLLEIPDGILGEEGEMNPSLWDETRKLVEGRQKVVTDEKVFKDLPFGIGSVVSHHVFGRGQVIAIQVDGACTVLFESGTERTLKSDFLRPEVGS